MSGTKTSNQPDVPEKHEAVGSCSQIGTMLAISRNEKNKVICHPLNLCFNTHTQETEWENLLHPIHMASPTISGSTFCFCQISLPPFFSASPRHLLRFTSILAVFQGGTTGGSVNSTPKQPEQKAKKSDRVW